MSTNYYVQTPEMKMGDERIHLGKTAAGWPFLFRAYPDANDRPAEVDWDVTDYASWTRLLCLGKIFSENGHEVSADQMLDLIHKCRRTGTRHRPQGRQYEDAFGNLFTPHDFY